MDKRDDRQREAGAMESAGETLGGIAGRMAGRAADAAVEMGSSMAASTLQALGGWWTGDEATDAAAGFSDNADAACRRHHESAQAGAGEGRADYESVRPVYGFGYVARYNPDYQGRSFDQVESDLERAWERAGRERHGEWSEVQDRVRFGYDGL